MAHHASSGIRCLRTLAREHPCTLWTCAIHLTGMVAFRQYYANSWIEGAVDFVRPDAVQRRAAYSRSVVSRSLA